MSSSKLGSPTLSSKLRVLIAKSFKAEKLYASMSGTGIDQRASVRAELANEVRAKEWERSYHQLRISLNKIVSEGKSVEFALELERLKKAFQKSSLESLEKIKSGQREMSDALGREEFAFVYKASLEMIRYKARHEACKIASQELDSLLEGRKKNTDIEPIELDDIDEMPSKAPKTSAKVISISRKRFASSRGK